MTVGEAIIALQNEDPKRMLVRRGYEGGVSEVTTIEPTKIVLNVNEEWYYGKHERSDKIGTVPAVFIN